MPASIWRFTGDPDELLAGYDALIAQTPSERLGLHLCLRAPDGIVIVDTCPTEQAWIDFRADPGFDEARARHGLPAPAIEAFPVHHAVVGGTAAAIA